MQFWRSNPLNNELRNSGVILDSSMVEHSAVNRVVVGSSPTRGAVRIIMIVKQVGRVVLLVQY